MYDPKTQPRTWLEVMLWLSSQKAKHDRAAGRPYSPPEDFGEMTVKEFMQGMGYDVSQLMNIDVTFARGFYVGFEIGMRVDKEEATAELADLLGDADGQRQ